MEKFHDVFENRANLAVMFISEHYVKKSWPTLERRSILSRAIRERSHYVLPVRFDEMPVPGLPTSIHYELVEKHGPEELATMIAEKIGIRRFEGKASDVPPPRMTSPTGEAVFDYSNHNGRYVIGRGPLEFLNEVEQGERHGNPHLQRSVFDKRSGAGHRVFVHLNGVEC